MRQFCVFRLFSTIAETRRPYIHVSECKILWCICIAASLLHSGFQTLEIPGLINLCYLNLNFLNNIICCEVNNMICDTLYSSRLF